MVSADSSLRRIPAGLDESQARRLEAIRLTLEMLAVAEDNLVATLLAISRASGARERGLDASALMHAWGVVDSVYRLSILLAHLPGLRKSQFPQAAVFLKAMAAIEEFRHYVQHMDRSIARGEGLPQRPWGALTWLYSEDASGQTFRLFVLSPGGPRAQVGWTAPRGKEISMPIGDICLEVAGTRRSISGDLDRCRGLAQDLDRSLEAAFRASFGDGYETHGADVLVELTFEAAVHTPGDEGAVDAEIGR